MSLNIDHSLIIKNAEKRSTALKKMETLISSGIHTALDGLRRAETLTRDIYTIYSEELDAEGQKMLPELVNLFIRARHFNQLETAISGNTEVIPGMESLAALFPKAEDWVPEPMHPYDAEADPAAPKLPILRPEADSNGQHYKLTIQFQLGWDPQQWPEGVWHATYEGEHGYGVGRTPDEAFKDLHRKS